MGAARVAGRVRPRPGGAWAVATHGAPPHVIGSRRGYGRLHLGDGWVTGPIAHPGTPGTGAWDRVTRAAPTLAVGRFDAAVAAAVGS